MTEPVIMYLVTKYQGIKEVKAVKATAKTVTIETPSWTSYSLPVRQKRRLFTDNAAIFPTWEEARDCALDWAEQRVNAVRRELNVANGQLGNVKGWKKPEVAG